jgi:hypothetical protein
MRTKKNPSQLATPVYLANAYSSKLTNKSDAKFQMLQRLHLESFIAGALKKKLKGKYCFLLPITMSASIANLYDFDGGFDTWAKDDYTWVSICAEVWVLTSDGWRESYGVQSEIKFAKSIGKPVKYINPFNLEVTEYPSAG